MGGLIVVALPHWPDLNPALCLPVSATAVITGLLLWTKGGHLAAGSFPWVAGAGTLIITLAVYGAGPHGQTTAIFFALLGLYIGAMFSTRVIVLEIGLFGVSYGACLLALDGRRDTPVQWLAAVVVTTVVAGVTAGITRSNRRAALQDPLTGLPNRRALDEALTVLVAVAARRGFPLSIAVLDLDDFKRVNAELGHQGADHLLVGLVRRWRTQVRPEDVLTRYGGDEFVLLLPDTGLDAAAAIVERLMHQDVRHGRFSAGVAMWDGSEGHGDLLRRADRALFQAKDGGRNRIALAERDHGP